MFHAPACVLPGMITHRQIGQVVRHKTIGYRGIVGGWDILPRQEVSGPTLGNKQPFYWVSSAIPYSTILHNTLLCYTLSSPACPHVCLCIESYRSDIEREMLDMWFSAIHNVEIRFDLLFICGELTQYYDAFKCHATQHNANSYTTSCTSNELHTSLHVSP